MTKKEIIYIAGYGRSGSTLLARLLGSHSDIFTAGELINYIQLVDHPDNYCSCGQKIQECSFWSDTIQQFTKNFKNISELRKSQNRVESMIRFAGLSRQSRSLNYSRFRDTNQSILGSISHQLHDNVRYIVDSSKTTTSRFFRPIMLSRICGEKVKLIHIVRDGRGCMWSMLKGTDTGLLKSTELQQQSSSPTFRTAIHWPIANLAAHLFQFLQPAGNYCRIKYEDLVEKPDITFSVLEDFLDVAFDRQVEIIKNGGEIESGHLLAGNRMRTSIKISVKADVEWKRKLNLSQELLFWLLNWPLMMFYRYRFRGNSLVPSSPATPTKKPEETT